MGTWALQRRAQTNNTTLFEDSTSHYLVGNPLQAGLQRVRGQRPVATCAGDKHSLTNELGRNTKALWHRKSDNRQAKKGIQSPSIPPPSTGKAAGICSGST